MALIKQLKSFLNKTSIYPKTVTKAVYDDNGNRLDNVLNNNKLQVVGDMAGMEGSVTIPKNGFYYLYASNLAYSGASYVNLEIAGLGNIASAHKNSNDVVSLSVCRVIYLTAGAVINKTSVNCENRGDAFALFDVVYLGDR